MICNGDEARDIALESAGDQTRTVAVQHPGMSHCLIIDTDARRLDSALRAWAASYVARHFGVVLDHTEFTVCNTSPSAEPFDLWGRNDD